MPKSRRRRRGNTDLPMDLIIDILSRLPVKTLIRFKSVSKSWFSLIQSPNFIKLHLNFSKLNPNPIFSSILSLDKISLSGYEFSIRLNLIDALDKPIDMNLPFMRGKARKFVGISNGLLCLMADDEYSLDIIISNPATGNFRKIPSFEPSTWYRDDSFYGFDSNEEGFVLIRIDCSSSSVNVGSFSSSANIWEDVKVNTKLTVFLHTFVQVPVLKNGVFYWDGSCDGAHYVLIFDVFNKVLDEILVPCGHGFELKEFKEQLVLIKIVDREFNVWTLNENDNTWKRLKSIDVSDSIPRYRFVTGLGYTGNGKLVLRCYNYTYSNSKLYLYDMETGDTNSLSDLNVEGIKGMYLFAESLVAV